jgi:hypothetical protein
MDLALGQVICIDLLALPSIASTSLPISNSKLPLRIHYLPLIENTDEVYREEHRRGLRRVAVPHRCRQIKGMQVNLLHVKSRC